MVRIFEGESMSLVNLYPHRVLNALYIRAELLLIARERNPRSEEREGEFSGN